MNRSTKVSCVVLAAALLLAACPVLGEEKPAQTGTGQNVLVTLTISRTGASGPVEKVYKFVGQDDSEASMLVGWRTPIPTQSAAREEAGKAPVTSYVYQNVGVNARLVIKVLGGGRISLRGAIEISGAREGQPVDSSGQKVPLIGTFQQGLTAVVEDGKKLRVASAPDPEGGTTTLDIEATLLR